MTSTHPFLTAVLLPLLIVCSSIAAVMFSYRNERDKVSIFTSIGIMVAVTILLGYSYKSASDRVLLFTLNPKDNGVYIVQKKVPDGAGALVFLFDTKKNIPQEGYFKLYPPNGFSETILENDGRTVLAVTGKQIVIGEPDEIEFVPSLSPSMKKEK